MPSPDLPTLPISSLSPAVYASPRPTNISYLLLKLKIGDDGVLTPMLNMGLTPVSLAKVNIDILKRMTSVTKAVPPQIEKKAPLDAPEAAVVIASGEDDVDFASGKDDVDFGDHFHCGSRDFQVFHSTSYGGKVTIQVKLPSKLRGELVNGCMPRNRTSSL